jgi:putative ABC transport system permease protein
MIPLKYNYRNLRVRWVTTLMNMLSIGMVVFVMVVTYAMTDGLEYALRISGHPLEMIVLRKGATDETGSTITTEQAEQLATQPEIARDEQGTPLCSNEFVTLLLKPRRHNAGTANMIVRGLEPVGRQMRPDFKIVDGRDLNPGVNEAISSVNLARRFENLGVNEKLEINKVDFTIVGHFEAGGSSAESEVWTDIRDLTTARRLPAAVSSVCIRARDAAAKEKLAERIRGEDDKQFQLNPVAETKYFEDQMTAALAMKFMGYFIAVFLTLGAMFAAANTMFAAVASRGREIGTLRALGFRRRSILSSFLLESVLLCLAGGALGCLATLPFNGFSTGTMHWATFSEITFEFRVGPWIFLRGLLMALTMGLLGGLLPAIRAVRFNVVKALREQ